MKNDLVSLFTKYLDSIDHGSPDESLIKRAEIYVSQNMEHEEYRWAEILYTIVNILELYQTILVNGDGKIGNLRALFQNHIEDLLEIEDK